MAATAEVAAAELKGSEGMEEDDGGGGGGWEPKRNRAVAGANMAELGLIRGEVAGTEAYEVGTTTGGGGGGGFRGGSPESIAAVLFFFSLSLFWFRKMQVVLC